jgi:hypothetical protein
MIVLVFAVACTGADVAAPSGSAPAATSVPASPAPVLADGIPGSFGQDLPGIDLPARELIPPKTRVADRLLTPTAAGEAVVIVYAKRGSDPFTQAYGVVVWRRDEGASPPWRAVFGVSHPLDEGLLAIQGITGDVTGDGSADALLFEATGGVGNCGRWRVIDLAAAAERWFRETCDAQIDINVDPPGLILTETVYEPGDPHCCPSSIRTSVLTYRAPDRFVEVSVESVAL